MVNGEYSPYNYKSSKISITAIIKNPQTLRFVPNPLKLKRYVIMQFKKTRYVHDQYKTQEICDKTVDSYAHALELDPGCSKAHRMFKC